MKRLRHDLNYLTSAGLLVTAVASALTGIIADLWDLNEFVYHTYASYTMVVFALAHVWFNWRRMVWYVRWRFARRGPTPRQELVARQRVAPQQTVAAPAQRPGPLAATLRAVISRRATLALLAGGIGGWSLSRNMRPPLAVPYGSDLGVIYHQWSKPGASDIFGTVANWGQQPPLYKVYPNLPQIVLPKPGAEYSLAIEETITRRRSVRDYSGQPMMLDELSRVLYYTNGVNAERWGLRLRAAPSAGALYAIEIYPVVHNVAGLSPGLYHYGVQDHALAQIRVDDLRAATVRQGVMQEFLGQANLVLYFTVIFQRMRWKYQDRTYRYSLLEAGHLGQNVYLIATAMGLGACAIGAFMDDEINAMLGVDGAEEAAVYMLAVGKV